MSGQATARARANIALAKYWGKCDDARNLPAVPSVSVTLSPMVTTTRVVLDPRLDADTLSLGGAPAREDERARAARLLDEVRTEAGARCFVRVESENAFPTASGLASSASGFAALAAAGRAAFGLPSDPVRTSILARRASASAARSVFGGFVELPAGRPGDDDLPARPLLSTSHWPGLRLVVAVVTEARKDLGSRDGMGLSRRTSPYYDAWVASAPGIAAEVRRGLVERDLARLGPALEQSFAAMHALALSTSPPTYYWQPGSMAALLAVRRLREVEGVPVFATMDAGPHVKAVCVEADLAQVERALAQTPGVLRTLVAQPGEGVEIDLA